CGNESLGHGLADAGTSSCDEGDFTFRHVCILPVSIDCALQMTKGKTSGLPQRKGGRRDRPSSIALGRRRAKSSVFQVEPEQLTKSEQPKNICGRGYQREGAASGLSLEPVA